MRGGLAKVPLPQAQAPSSRPGVDCDGSVISAHEAPAELRIHIRPGDDPVFPDIQVGGVSLAGTAPPFLVFSERYDLERGRRRVSPSAISHTAAANGPPPRPDSKS